VLSSAQALDEKHQSQRDQTNDDADEGRQQHGRKTTEDPPGDRDVSRRMDAVECPKFYSGSTGLRSPIDRWQDIEYHAPGYYLLHVRVAPVGSTPHGEREDPQAAHMKVLYAITPIDDHRTMDFWAVCRDFGIGEPALDRFIAESNRAVVLQDVEALNLIESRLGDTWEPTEVSLKIDTGGLAARRAPEPKQRRRSWRWARSRRSS